MLVEHSSYSYLVLLLSSYSVGGEKEEKVQTDNVVNVENETEKIKHCEDFHYENIVA